MFNLGVNKMIRYEEIKEEIILSQIEIQDEIDYYQKKIEEFKNKKQKKALIFEKYNERLDEYVINDYKKDVSKAWAHFLSAKKNDKTTLFFDKFFQNTGFSVSPDHDQLVFMIDRNKIDNIKKSGKILKAIFDISSKFLCPEPTIMLCINIKNKNKVYFVFKEKENYLLKEIGKKKNIIKEKNEMLFLDLLISLFE